MKTLLFFTLLSLTLSAFASKPSIFNKSNALETTVLWDGDTKTLGQSWVSLHDKELDSAAFEIFREKKTKKIQALKFKIAGRQYMGFGWNWLNQWGVNDGMDLRDYKTLSFKFKAKGVKLPSHLNSITFQLAGGGAVPTARSKAYGAGYLTSKDLFSGKWQHVDIPLNMFFNTKNQGAPELRSHLVREFSIGVNPTEYVDFDIYIDDLVVSR